MKTFLSFFICILSVHLSAQEVAPNFALQNPDTVKQELHALFQELSLKHPGFYRYNDSADFNAYLDSAINSIKQPLTELDILRLCKPLLAKIGCLHTGIHLSEESERKLNEKPNCLPLFLITIEDKAYVWKTFGPNNPLQAGDEIISINGQPIAEIYQKLLAAIPMDGYNLTGKYRLLQYSFPQWYRTMIAIDDHFEVQSSEGITHQLSGIKESVFPNYQDIMDQGISVDLRNEIAILRIPSFANSYLQAHQQKFKVEIQRCIALLKAKGIKKLLIDLRGNTGGTDSHAAYLSSFFFDKPYRYWKYIEVTEGIAKELRGGKRLFYGKPSFEEGKWLWTDKGLYGKEFSFSRVQKGSKEAYEGSVYILADGLCMSSCADFVAIMQFNQKALVIGEESGGGYMGNTSGLIPSQELENGLVIDIPLLKYYNYVDTERATGRGSIPDIEITPKLEEVIDPEAYLDRVLELIKQLE